MKNTTTDEKSGIVLYIVPREARQRNAISSNIQRRKTVLEKLGFRVILIEQGLVNLFFTLRLLIADSHHVHAVIIRIDGACTLDSYTLMKLAALRVRFIWEVHGFPEEQLTFSDTPSGRRIVWGKNLKRRVLSYLVDTCIFISSQLQSYAKGKIYIRKSVTIPNFIEHPLPSSVGKPKHPISCFLRKNTRIVLWGGSGDLPWQAIDLLQKTAHAVYQKDKRILFLSVSSEYWSPMHEGNNMLMLAPMVHEQFLKLISTADVCLALYHKPGRFPFYFFPMKILDYMSLGKPVIASDVGTIPQLIQNGFNGYLTRNAVQDISTKIISLVNNAALSRTLSRNAVRTVTTRFGQQLALRQYRELFEN